jgi:hypothetical protein
MTATPPSRTRKLAAALLAAGLLVVPAACGEHASPNQAARTTTPVQTAPPPNSTVPAELTRAETAAEDVIGFLEQRKPAKSKAEARILADLAHGQAAASLRLAKVPAPRIKAFQQRADRTRRLSSRNARPLPVSLAANSVSQLMPSFYAHYHDPVPPTVLKLDYLDREVQLRSQAGQRTKVRGAVRKLQATWRQLRPQLVKRGGTKEAKAYDRHVSALKRGGRATAIQKQAVHGLDVVDKMEGVFLGK